MRCSMSNLIVHLIVALPTFALPYPCLRAFIRSYALTSLWLLRVVCRIKVEWRGTERIPAGACIVACKHQSLWETFSLYAVLDDPTYVLKRELMWLPLFGWYMAKAGLIPIDRSAGMAALARMTAARAQSALRRLSAPDRYFPGRHPAAAGRRAELQARHRASIQQGECRRRSARAKLGSVLAAPLLASPARHDCRGISRADPTRPRQSGVFQAAPGRH